MPPWEFLPRLMESLITQANGFFPPHGWMERKRKSVHPFQPIRFIGYPGGVKGDWLEQTGTLSFEVLAQDRDALQPVDLHFLELPLARERADHQSLTRKRCRHGELSEASMDNGVGWIGLQQWIHRRWQRTVLVSSNLQVSKDGRDRFIQSTGHRWAKMVETSLAREAATPGGVNQWSASNQVKPRNLPSQVNEYGFDVGNHGNRAWWVVKSSTLPFPEFNSTVFSVNGSQDDYFGKRVAAYGNLVAVAPQNSQKKIYLYEYSESNGSLSPKFEIRPGDLNQNSSYSNGFSESMAFDNGYLAVGAHDAYINNEWGAGAVYLFSVNGSVPYQLGKISASGDGTSSDNFGRSVDLAGDLIVVGAPYDDAEGYSESGSAYVFSKGEQWIHHPDRQVNSTCPEI